MMNPKLFFILASVSVCVCQLDSNFVGNTVRNLFLYVITDIGIIVVWQGVFATTNLKLF